MSHIISINGMIAVFIGTILGAAVAYSLTRYHISRLMQRLAGLQLKVAIEGERTANKDSQIDQLKDALKRREQVTDTLQKKIEQDQARIAALQVTLEKEQKSAAEKIALLERAEKNMNVLFENIANKIFEEKGKKITDQNKVNINQVLAPLREQLLDFRKKIEAVYHQESKDRTALHYEITHLKSLNERISKDAINLTRALKGESKKRGDWGELILERVLELSGLKKGREYEAQVGYHDDQNKRYHPDIVVHLPGNRDIVIDSKISLNAYDRYYAAQQEQEKKQALDQHLRSIREHIVDLKNKKYNQLPGINTLDMVFMFIAIEPALILALEHDEQLIQHAFKNGIFLVSPSTLTMNIRLVHNLWRYEYQQQNATEIAKKAGDMYDKFVGFTDALEEIGNRLDKVNSAYDIARKRLVDGKGSLVSRAKALHELGLSTNKRLAEHLAEDG